MDSIVTSAVVIDGAHAGAPFGMPFVDARLCTDALSSAPHCERDGRCGSDTGSDVWAAGDSPRYVVGAGAPIGEAVRLRLQDAFASVGGHMVLDRSSGNAFGTPSGNPSFFHPYPGSDPTWSTSR